MPNSIKKDALQNAPKQSNLFINIICKSYKNSLKILFLISLLAIPGLLFLIIKTNYDIFFTK